MHLNAPATEKSRNVAAAPHDAGARAVETPRLLFVDDHADFLSMVKLIYRGDDYDLKTEPRSLRALEIAAEFAPHILISDITMPLLDGYELVKKLRENPAIAPFKAIALSGYSDAEHQDKALLAGFDACLIKPVDFDELRQTIDNLCGELSIATLPERRLELNAETRNFPEYVGD